MDPIIIATIKAYMSASLVGWIAVDNDIINLQTGLRIRNLSDTKTARADVQFLNGDVETYDGEDAEAILERAEIICQTATSLAADLVAIQDRTVRSGN